jgi:hypothetical protein
VAKTKKGVAYWKKKLIGPGGVLNEYVKWRDAHAITEDGKPIANCITCGRAASGRSLHAGHWISRRYVATAYMEENVHAQCAGCNKYGNGEPQKYREFLIDFRGQDVVDELEATYKQIKKWKPHELEELYNDYKIMLENARRNV